MLDAHDEVVRVAAPSSETLARTLSVGDAVRLLEAVQALSYLTDFEGVTKVVRRYARDLTGADGITVVLRDGDHCFYAEENAIGPLWKGRRFPVSACVSGWCMTHREQVVIRDIYADPRVPADAYRPTFVKSLAMVPVRPEDPIAAIGAYWATHHQATDRELALLQSLANTTATAIANAELLARTRRAEERMAEAVRLRDEFLSVAGHELRTPLTALQLQLQGVQRLVEQHALPGTTPREDERLAKAVHSAQRLGRLVDELLDVTRITLGRMHLELTSFDLAELAEETVARFGPAASTARAELRLRNTSIRITGDRIRLDQVLANLLGNALKYGAGQPIDVELVSVPAEARIIVRDRGIGIAEADQRRIFERFERAVSERHYGGLGLGLWISRQIVEAHGGRIDVESMPSQGATFTVSLPVAQAQGAGRTP